MSNLKNARSLDDFATKIRARWRDSVSGILDVARTLAQAREELDKDKFQELTKRLKFSKGTTSKLLAIAGDTRLAKVSPGKLPASWSTLYALTKLKDDEFEQGIRNRVINATMLRSHIAWLKPRKMEPAAPREPILKGADLVKRRTFETRQVIVSAMGDMSSEERAEFFAMIRLQLEDIESRKKAETRDPVSSEGSP